MSTDAVPPPIPTVPEDSIKAPPDLPAEPIFAARESIWYELHAKGLEQDIKERKIYAERIWNLTVGSLLGLAIVIWLNGFQYRNGFQISDKVIIALIGSTTVEIIGLFVLVARYLFPAAHSLSKDENPSTSAAVKQLLKSLIS